MDFKEAFQSHQIEEEHDSVPFLLESQYREAYDILEDAYNAGLYVGIVGPVGSGKTSLCRRFAQDHDKGFSWLTFSDLIRPATLIGTFDPTLVFKMGYNIDSFIPGPFTQAAVQGNIFFANEVNRGEEYVLNSLLDAMEEKRLYVPQLKKWVQVDSNFFFIAAMNPSDMRGTRVLPQAFKDRIRVWITLDYPSQETELKILQMNVPELNIPEDVYGVILEIINNTRKSDLINLPASIRASIAFIKLLIKRQQRTQGDLSQLLIRDVGKLVLLKTLEFAPGVNELALLEKLMDQAFLQFPSIK